MQAKEEEMSSFILGSSNFKAKKQSAFYEINGVQMVPFCITSCMASFESGFFLTHYSILSNIINAIYKGVR